MILELEPKASGVGAETFRCLELWPELEPEILFPVLQLIKTKLKLCIH